ncbi:Gfo/Idh/MocA family oxidoreductase [Candidatus Gracilibacteria bacterium]|nr:Gfo/Idh/MocA family oxidoreductase [Candidatus Gracilibacteria bacterium]
MAKKTLKAAVIGTGNMGKNHVRIYGELQLLCAIADTNEKLGQDLAAKHDANYYADYKELIEKEEPDIVSICVPTSLHHQVGKYCLSKGIHVLLEKPIAMNAKEGQDLLDTAKKHKVSLMVGHIERFNPAVVKVKEMIKKGELGNITAIMARRVGGFPPQIKDADIAVDLAIHDIDIVNYLLEEQPREIHSNKLRNHIKHREDSVEFFLKYASTSAYIQANWITPVKIRKLNITGTEGYLEMDFITQKIEFYKSNYEKFEKEFDGFSDFILRFSDPEKFSISVAKKEPLKEEILHFIKSVTNNKPIDSTFALDALKIALK